MGGELPLRLTAALDDLQVYDTNSDGHIEMSEAARVLGSQGGLGRRWVRRVLQDDACTLWNGLRDNIMQQVYMYRWLLALKKEALEEDFHAARREQLKGEREDFARFFGAGAPGLEEKPEACAALLNLGLLKAESTRVCPRQRRSLTVFVAAVRFNTCSTC
jgi:hypothetical protein